MKKKKRDKAENAENFRKTLSAMLELPREITLDLPLITMLGAEELTIENYKGVIEYADDRIRINTKCGILRIEGKKMLIKRITSENILVGGAITKMEYLQ